MFDSIQRQGFSMAICSGIARSYVKNFTNLVLLHNRSSQEFWMNRFCFQQSCFSSGQFHLYIFGVSRVTCGAHLRLLFPWTTRLLSQWILDWWWVHGSTARKSFSCTRHVQHEAGQVASYVCYVQSTAWPIIWLEKRESK